MLIIHNLMIIKRCIEFNFLDLTSERIRSRALFLFVSLLAFAYSLITVFTITPQVCCSPETGIAGIRANTHTPAHLQLYYPSAQPVTARHRLRLLTGRSKSLTRTRSKTSPSPFKSYLSPPPRALISSLNVTPSRGRKLPAPSTS